MPEIPEIPDDDETRKSEKPMTARQTARFVATAAGGAVLLAGTGLAAILALSGGCPAKNGKIGDGGVDNGNIPSTGKSPEEIRSEAEDRKQLLKSLEEISHKNYSPLGGDACPFNLKVKEMLGKMSPSVTFNMPAIEKAMRDDSDLTYTLSGIQFRANNMIKGGRLVYNKDDIDGFLYNSAKLSSSHSKGKYPDEHIINAYKRYTPVPDLREDIEHFNRYCAEVELAEKLIKKLGLDKENTKQPSRP